jgi:lysophospholipase L1-like esterase
MHRVLILGDSIARGDGASRAERSFIARWTITLTTDVTRYYFCRGGATSDTGREWALYVWCDPPPDVVIVSYGMNDQTRRAKRFGRRGDRALPPHRYRENIRAAVEVLRERWRDVPIALIAPIDSHPAWTGTSGTANEYRDCLLEVGQDTGAIAVDATSAWEEAIEMGASVDALFANSANHPSDAGHAIIADALARADLRVASR